MKPREERYLEKIKNDIDENLFDLLIMHLNNIKLYDFYQGRLILEEKLGKENKISYKLARSNNILFV